MHLSHVQCKRHELNVQINVNTQRDNKGIVKSNFGIQCLAFRDSIPTGTTSCLLGLQPIGKTNSIHPLQSVFLKGGRGFHPRTHGLT